MRSRGAPELVSQRPDSSAFVTSFQTKNELAYRALRRWIVLGRLRPEQKIDQELLAASLGVSRMPLRQALLRLEADGLVQSWPHRGAAVTPLKVSDVEDIYAARIALEGMLSEAGAHRSAQKIHAAMAGCIRAQERAISAGRVGQFVDQDRRFHRQLYSASGYMRACEIVERLRDVADRYIFVYASHDHGGEQSIMEHRKILEHCRRHDAKNVRRIVENHVERGLLTLVQIMQNDEASKL